MEGQIEHQLVVGFGFGEQNVQFVRTIVRIGEHTELVRTSRDRS